MARFEVSVDSSQMSLRLGRVAKGLAGPEMLDEAGHYMAQTALPMRFREGGPGWPSVARGGSPLRDTGALSKSFAHSVQLSDRAVIIASNVIYGGPHHRGDTVTPKRGKYLAIPLPTLTISERRTKGPRDFENTFIQKSRNGNLIVFQKLTSKKTGEQRRGKNKFASSWTPGQTKAATEDLIRPIFVLKESVKLKARRFMYFSEKDVSVIRRRLAKRAKELSE